jgi:hypothetical protein
MLRVGVELLNKTTCGFNRFDNKERCIAVMVGYVWVATMRLNQGLQQ